MSATISPAHGAGAAMAGQRGEIAVGERIKEQIESRKDKIEERIGDRLKGLLNR